MAFNSDSVMQRAPLASGKTTTLYVQSPSSVKKRMNYRVVKDFLRDLSIVPGRHVWL